MKSKFNEELTFKHPCPSYPLHSFVGATMVWHEFYPENKTQGSYFHCSVGAATAACMSIKNIFWSLFFLFKYARQLLIGFQKGFNFILIQLKQIFLNDLLDIFLTLFKHAKSGFGDR